MGWFGRKQEPETPQCATNEDGSTTCTCLINVRDRDTLNHTVSNRDIYADRYGDNGLNTTGTLDYTSNVLAYSNGSCKFDLSYKKDEEGNDWRGLIKAKVRVNVQPSVIYAKTNSSTKPEYILDASGAKKIFPHENQVVANGVRYSLDNDYKYIVEAIAFANDTEKAGYITQSKILSSGKIEVEKILNKTPYYFVPKSCCGASNSEYSKTGGCKHKIKIVFEVELGVNLDNAHEKVNLHRMSRRQDSGNWSEKEERTSIRLLMEKEASGAPKRGADGKVIFLETRTTSEVDVPFRVIAHECGHLFGFPDEYFQKGGGVYKNYINSEKKIILNGFLDDSGTLVTSSPQMTDNWRREDNTKLMNSGVQLDVYYLAHIKKWFDSFTNKEWKVTS